MNRRRDRVVSFLLRSLIILLIWSVGLIMPSFGQTVNPAKVNVNGVSLDSTYSQVVKALGKPVKDGKPGKEECIGARAKVIEYNGLSFFLMDGDSKDGRTFEVKSFFVTAGNWIVSGVKIGDTEAAVRTSFGQNYTSGPDPETDDPAWFYDISDASGPGTTIVVFRSGRVVNISTGYQVC